MELSDKLSLVDIIPEEEDGRIGAEIGNLQLCSRLGVGGMGAVYLAKHRILEMNYAVKVLHPRFSEDPVEVERFRIEAIATSRLRHENIVFVTDFGFDPSLGLYLVMEHLNGQSLLDLIHFHGALSPGRSIHIIRQVAAAMKEAHGMNITHRDLKPENIILLNNRSMRDHVKVLDFGIAAMKDDETSSTDQQIIGTPNYMAPEQIIGNDGANSPLVDIYALGMLLYTMICGHPAFQADDLEALLKAKLWEKAPKISLELQELSGTKLEKLISDALQNRASERPASIGQFIEELSKAQIELEKKGISGIHYTPLNDEEEPYENEDTTILQPLASKTIRMTAVIRQIRVISPNSAAGLLLEAIPALESLRGEALCGALWGVIQQELLMHDVEDTEFQIGCDQLVLLMQAILESNETEVRSLSQDKIFRVLSSTLPVFGEKKYSYILTILRSLSTHPNYPHEWLSHSGSWESFKKIMTTEIHLPWRRSPGQVRPNTQASSAQLAKMSLFQKLKQEVSVQSIEALLQHEINIFKTVNEDSTNAEDGIDKNEEIDLNLHSDQNE